MTAEDYAKTVVVRTTSRTKLPAWLWVGTGAGMIRFLVSLELILNHETVKNFTYNDFREDFSPKHGSYVNSSHNLTPKADFCTLRTQC